MATVPYKPLLPTSIEETMIFEIMKERYIPTDILLNILNRIPASSLKRLRLVNKEWFQIISDPDFVEAHLAHQSQDKFGWGFFLNTTKGIFFMGPTFKPPQRVNFPRAGRGSCIFGSCNGYVLFTSSNTRDTKFNIANPVTGECSVLPSFNGYNEYIRSASIGCSGGQIKVVILLKQLRPTTTTLPFVCKIFTLGSSSWRKMLTPIRGCRLEKPFVQPVFTRGAFYWCYDTGILSLDLGREKFHQTKVAFCSSIQLKQCAHYMEWDGCYAVILLSRKPSRLCIIWVLRESGWEKQPDINNTFFDPLGYFSGLDLPYHSVSMRNGEIILFLQYVEGNVRLFLYDLGRRVMTKYSEFSDDFHLHCKKVGRCSVWPHVNSLVSCSTDSAPKKKISICGKGVSIFRLMFKLLMKISTCFTCM